MASTQTKKLFASPSEHLRPIILLMKYLGIWGIESDSSALKIAYAIASLLSRWGIPYLTALFQIVSLFYVSNMTELVETVSLLITYVNFIYKLNLILRKLDRAKVLCLRSNQLIFQPKNRAEEKILSDAMRESKFHCAYYMCVAFITATANGHVSLFVGGNHPYNSWYPFESKNPDKINFYLTGLFEAVNLWSLALVNGGTDVFLIFLIGMAYYQTRLLGYRLTQLGWAKAQQSHEQHINDFNQLIECVRLRREIDEYVAEYHRLFNSVIFVQVVQSVIFFTMTTLRIMIVPFGSLNFILNVMYLKTMATGVFEYCGFGNRLIYSSRDLSTEVFCCNFVAFDMRTKKSLLFFMQYLQNYEISITAVGVFRFSLSFATLVAILRTSYSYITVMRSVS